MRCSVHCLTKWWFGMMTLLQTTFVVLAGITFLVSATVADTIHLVSVVANRYPKSIFKNKKIDPDRSPTCCHPRRLSLGHAEREELPSPCTQRRRHHQGRQWSPSPCTVEEARSRSVSICLRSGSIRTTRP
jgi:hypothetical protein